MEHNFMQNMWGHAQYMSERERGVFTGAVITTPRVKVGDTIVWPTAYGQCVVEATKVDRPGDPVDYHNVEAKVVERRVNRSMLDIEEPPFEYTVIEDA